MLIWAGLYVLGFFVTLPTALYVVGRLVPKHTRKYRIGARYSGYQRVESESHRQEIWEKDVDLYRKNWAVAVWIIAVLCWPVLWAGFALVTGSIGFAKAIHWSFTGMTGKIFAAADKQINAATLREENQKRQAELVALAVKEGDELLKERLDEVEREYRALMEG